MNGNTLLLVILLIILDAVLWTMVLNRVIGEKVTQRERRGVGYWFDHILVWLVADTSELRLIYYTNGGKKRWSEIHKIERQWWQCNRLYTIYRKRKLYQWSLQFPKWQSQYVHIESRA